MANAAQKNAAQQPKNKAPKADPWDLPAESSLPPNKGGVQSGATSSTASTSKTTKGGDNNMAKTKKEPAPKGKAVAEVDLMSTVNPKYRKKVVRVAAANEKGTKATRVVIECSHEGCSNEREIATQDLFQVKFCAEHQRSGKKKAAKPAAAKTTAKASTKAKGKAAKAATAEAEEAGSDE